METIFTVNDLESLADIVTQITKESKHQVYCLYGEIGAGKTTFVRSYTSLKDADELASSPTFSIINEYTTKHKKIIHMDLYRLKTLQEVLDIGFEDYLFDPNCILFIEWPDLILPILDKNYHSLQFEILKKDVRKIIFS